MDFEEFQKRMVQEIRKNLPKEYSDAEIETVKLNKINQTYTGLVIRTKKDGAVPAIDLDSVYKIYQKGGNLDDLAKGAIKTATSPVEHIAFDYIYEYESVKNRLFVRVSNAERNKELLQSVPHKTIGDIAMTYHIFVDERNGSLASITISNNLFKLYGVTAEQLHHDSLENGQKLFPASIKTFGDMLSLGARHANETDSYLIVTNSSSINGAAALFYPGVMTNVGEKLGSDYYIIPSSIHEMIVVANDGNSNPRVLEGTLRNANMTVVSDEDQLSDTLYHFDQRHNLFETFESFDKRLDAEFAETAETQELVPAENPFLSQRNQSL